MLEHIWHWFDYHRNRCRDITGGSSGSPVISRWTGRLLGLISTTTIGAPPYTDCVLNHPCEPVAGNAAGFANTSYMTPLVRVARCFDEGGRFDLMRQGCPLETDLQVRVTPPFLGAQNPHRGSTVLGPARRRWDVTVSGVFEDYRYKVVSAASGDCRDLRGYGAPRRVLDYPSIDDPLPAGGGYQFLCVIGGSRAMLGMTWQSVQHPAIVVAQIDTTPPLIPARIDIIESDLAWSVRFGILDPEISAYTFKFGRPGETRCDDPAGYRVALIPFITLSKANRPYVFCAIPHDRALNPGPPYEALLP